MQAQVLTVTASVPSGVQLCANEEVVLQEGRSATSARRCRTLERCCRCTHAVNQFHARQSQSYTEEPQTSGTEHCFLGAVGLGSAQRFSWRHTLNICGQDISFKIDTGTDVSVVSRRPYQSSTQTKTRTNPDQSTQPRGTNASHGTI